MRRMQRIWGKLLVHLLHSTYILDKHLHVMCFQVICFLTTCDIDQTKYMYFPCTFIDSADVDNSKTR